MRVPLATVADAGVNTTEIVQLAAGVEQVVPMILNAATSTVGVSAVRAPELVTVTVNAGLGCPTSTSLKLRNDGENFSKGPRGRSGRDGARSGMDGLPSGRPPSPGETGVAPTHAPALLHVFAAGQSVLEPQLCVVAPTP
jgi:hypothetical protein